MKSSFATKPIDLLSAPSASGERAGDYRIGDRDPTRSSQV